MDVHVQIIRAEVKGLSNYELQCQVEVKDAKALKKSAAINSASPASWPKFTFNFKQVCQSAVFLFSVIDMSPIDVESSTESLTHLGPKTVANCLFPFTFSLPPNSKHLQHLASEVSTRAKQVQVAYLTSDIKGSDVTKVVGRIRFKVISPKVPKVKTKVKWSDLIDAIQSQLQSKKQVPLSLPELLEKENELNTSSTFPGSVPKVCVVFHSVNTYLKTPSFTPAANIGTKVIPREKSLFSDTENSKSLFTFPILKSVRLACEDREHHLELYLANNDLVIFTAGHPMQMFKPFKRYNWGYNWRWMAGTGGLSPLHEASGLEEPTMTVSITLTPSADKYSKFEGLEFLVYGMEIDASVRKEDIVLSVQVADLASKSRSQTARSTISTLNTKVPPFMNSKDNVLTASRSSLDEDTTHDTSVAVVKLSKSTETSPAYFFYPLSFFRSKAKGVSLTLQLYAPNSKHKRRLWWQASRVASAEIEIPSTLSSVLSSSENSNGVYWELNDRDIAQSDSESVAFKIFGVMRWKSPTMKFLTEDIGAQIHSLRNFKDLAPVKGIQPGLLTSILSEELRQEFQDEAKSEPPSDYKAAVKKMGIDILHLREQNKILRRDNKRLEEHLLQLENSVILSSSDQAALSVLTKADLIHKILEQSKRLQAEIAARKLCQDKIKALQNSLIEKNELEARFIEMQQAHSAQQKLVRDLQLKYEKYRKCSDICKQQEDVIFQLESLFKQSARDGQVREAIAVLSKENARLRRSLHQSQEPSHSSHPSSHTQEATITALRADLQTLRGKCSDLEKQLEDSRRRQTIGLHEQTKAFEANQRVKVAAAKERTLLQQLEENAKLWAQEKARYEVQLAEYQTRVQSLEYELSNCRRKAATQGQRSRGKAGDRHSQVQTRASQVTRNPWQQRTSEDHRQLPLLRSISQELGHDSRNSFRTQPPSLFDDSLETRLSF